jgi:phage-related protein
MFVEILQKVAPGDLPAKPPQPMLDASETEQLRRTLNFIDRFGLESLAEGSRQDSRSNEWKPPVIEKLKGGPYRGILEFKFANTKHNPRLFGSKCVPERLVFLHAFKKKSNAISQVDKDVARKRLADLKQRGECE